MAGIESELPESYTGPSNSPLSATEEDSSSSKWKSPMSATHESVSSSKGGSTDGGVEEDVDEDYDGDDIASDADTDDLIEYMFCKNSRQVLSDDDFYDPGRRAMIDEESSAYAKQIRDSEGFDIDPPPPGVRPLRGTVFPCPVVDDCCRRFTEFAIQRHNSDEGRKLKLKRIIKWNHKLACPVNYYITFEAEDVDTGEVETYQTKVERLIPEEESEVPIFRVKPPASVAN